MPKQGCNSRVSRPQDPVERDLTQKEANSILGVMVTCAPQGYGATIQNKTEQLTRFYASKTQKDAIPDVSEYLEKIMLTTGDEFMIST